MNIGILLPFFIFVWWAPLAGADGIPDSPGQEKEEMMKEESISEVSPEEGRGTQQPPGSETEVGAPDKGEQRPEMEETQILQQVSVRFESDPPNADVEINGLYVGSTPIQIPLLEGVHFIRILRDGYKPWEVRIKAYHGLEVVARLVKEEAKKEQ